MIQVLHIERYDCFVDPCSARLHIIVVSRFFLGYNLCCDGDKLKRRLYCSSADTTADTASVSRTAYFTPARCAVRRRTQTMSGPCIASLQQNMTSNGSRFPR
jgi:hypothetical protein